ncbi:hypothetical protein bcgnr5387_09460 [Bacillus luti]
MLHIMIADIPIKNTWSLKEDKWENERAYKFVRFVSPFPIVSINQLLLYYK